MAAGTTTTTTNYALHGKNIVHLTQGNHDLHFFYDASNRPAVVEYNETRYGYVHNLQGDICQIVDANGAVVVEYTYDAWGKVLNVTGSMAGTLGEIQPFRYRGYVYDVETGFYYASSRYYDLEICRWINVDDPETITADFESFTQYKPVPHEYPVFKGCELSHPTWHIGFRLLGRYSS